LKQITGHFSPNFQPFTTEDTEAPLNVLNFVVVKTFPNMTLHGLYAVYKFTSLFYWVIEKSRHL